MRGRSQEFRKSGLPHRNPVKDVELEFRWWNVKHVWSRLRYRKYVSTGSATQACDTESIVFKFRPWSFLYISEILLTSSSGVAIPIMFSFTIVLDRGEENYYPSPFVWINLRSSAIMCIRPALFFVSTNFKRHGPTSKVTLWHFFQPLVRARRCCVSFLSKGPTLRKSQSTLRDCLSTNSAYSDPHNVTVQ